MASTEPDPARTVRVHITQDDFGYWMMTLERGDGALTLAAYALEFPDHAVDDAYHPERAELPPDAEFLVSEPTVPLRLGAAGWARPQPRRAREPYYVVRGGRRVG